MRNLKKVLTLVLCLAMMMSIMVVGAGAAFSDQSKIENTEAVDMCVALNIINGYTDGSYKPEGNVTRAEMCKMICIALNGGKEPATATKATPTYSDIDGHWAEGYIEYCNTKGIVAGVGAGKFNPNGNVTGSQAAKMLLVALGYNADVEKYTGASWELYVNVQANQDGLYTDLESMDPSAALSRDNAAQMIWNALGAKVIEKTSSIDRNDGSITDMYGKGDDTLLEKVYGATDDEYGQMVKFEYDSDKDEWTYYFESVAGQSQASQLSHASFTSPVDYTDLYGQTVKVIYDEKNNGDVNNVYGIYAKDGKILATGVVGDLGKATAGTDDKITIDGVSYKLENNATAYYYTYDLNVKGENGVTPEISVADLSGDTQLGNQALKGFEFVAVDDDDNNKIDFFMVYPFSVAEVTYVGSKNFTIDYCGSNVTETFKFDDVVAYSGLAEDDFVVLVPAENSATNDDVFTKVSTVLSGSVTAVQGNYKFSLDGTWYESVYTIDNGLTADGSIKSAPVVNGYVFGGDGSGSKSVTDYAVVVAAGHDAYGYTAKLMFSDGTKKVVDTDVSYEGQQWAGALVSYEINSDDEYELTLAANLSAAADGFDNVITSFVSGDLKTSNNKVQYIGGADIADDAVIFVQEVTTDATTGDTSTSYKVITGARLKTTDGSNMSIIRAYSDSNSSSGYNTVKLAYVTNSAAITTTDSSYAYVVSDAAEIKNSDGKLAYSISAVDENGKDITLVTKDRGSASFNAQEGQVISYTVNADGYVDQVSVIGTTGTGVKGTGTTDAIVAYSGNYINLETAGGRYEITSDTVILVIDAEGPSVAEGVISKAYKDINGAWVDNVIVDLDTSDKEVDLLVIDYQNDIADVD